MAKLRTLQSNLNSGELSPLLRGRMDVERYQSGLERCRNALPLVLGGGRRRPGSRFVGTPAASEVWLFPFTPTLAGVLTGYILEFTAGKIRFYKQGARLESAGVPVEVVTPYQTTDLEGIKYEQADNALFLVHPNYPPKRLTRTSDTSWTLADLSFSGVPYFRPAETEGVSLTPSAASGSITLTASANLFVSGHVGSRFRLNGGEVEITGVTSGTVASALVSVAPDTTGLNTITSTATVTVDADALVGTHIVTIYSDANYPAKTLNTHWTGESSPDLTVSAGYSQALLSGIDPDMEWKEKAWGVVRGYPAAISFYEQRLILAQTLSQPTTVWGSKIGALLTFEVGTLDDEAFAFSLAQASTPINQLASGDQLLALTFNKEILLRGGGDTPITPTNVQVKGPTSHGSSATVRPVQLGSEVYFCGAGGYTLRSLRYRLDIDGFAAPDLGLLAEHLLEAGLGIIDMAFARKPYSSIFAVTRGGHLLTLTIDSDQEVVAWAQHYTGDSASSASYQSVAVIPDADGQDQVWIAGTRGGSSFVEYFDAALATDSAMTGSDAGGKTTWGGLAHLEGQQVDIVADGFVLPRQTVTGGQVLLGFAATAVQIGLPFTTRIKDLPPYFEGAAGAAASCNAVRVLLHQAQGCSVNGEQLPFRFFDLNAFDTPVLPFTGWKEINIASGWSSDGDSMQVEIVQDMPLPLTVLAISKEVSINA